MVVNVIVMAPEIENIFDGEVVSVITKLVQNTGRHTVTASTVEGNLLLPKKFFKL